MKTFVIVYFFDGHTKFDYRDFPTAGEASEWAETEQSRMNEAGTDVSVMVNEK